MKEDWKYEKIYSKQQQWETVLEEVSATKPAGEIFEAKIPFKNPLTAKDNVMNSSSSVSKLYNYGHGNTGKAFIAPLLDLKPKRIGSKDIN